MKRGSSSSSSRTELTAYAGILSAFSAAVLVLAPWRAATLVGALVLVSVPAGAAVMGWVDAGEDAAQAGLTLAISVSIVAIVSTIMIWAATWHPRALLVLAGASMISCAARLWLGASR